MDFISLFSLHLDKVRNITISKRKERQNRDFPEIGNGMPTLSSEAVTVSNHSASCLRVFTYQIKILSYIYENYEIINF